MVTTRSSSPRATGRPLAAVSSLLFLASVLLLFAMPGTAAVLAYDRAGVDAGQIWRLLTAHLTHWNSDHLFWDATVFLLLGILCEHRSRARTVACILVSGVAITGTLWLFTPELSSYRGLSGIDSALFAMLATWLAIEAVHAGDRARVTLVLIVTGAFAAKVAFECATGATLFVDSSGEMQPVPLAHVIGGVVGLALGVRGPREGITVGELRRRANTRSHVPRPSDVAEGGPGARSHAHRARMTRARA
jgi:rhomboid family GlyGly-CTERM serine protease